MQGTPLAQELGTEDDVLGPHPRPHVQDVAHRDRRLDDHRRVRRQPHDVGDHRLDGPGVEVVGDLVVVGRRGDDDELRAGVGLGRVGREPEGELFLGEESLDVLVVDGALAAAQQLDPVGVEVEADDLVVPREQAGHRESDITEPGNSDLGGHCAIVPGERSDQADSAVAIR